MLREAWPAPDLVVACPILFDFAFFSGFRIQVYNKFTLLLEPVAAGLTAQHDGLKRHYIPEKVFDSFSAALTSMDE